MDRITNPELQTDPREFIEGDEHTPATPLDPNWLTTLQEELLAVILASGQTPSDVERDQLLKAIQSMGYPPATETEYGVVKLATQAQTDAGAEDDVVVTPKKLKAWVKQATETVLGMLKVATQDQVIAGTSDDHAVTPKKLRMGFAVKLGNTGYLSFPVWLGSFILQWGSLTVPMGIVGGIKADITFPIAYPNAAFGIATTSGVNIGNMDINAEYRLCRQDFSVGIPTQTGVSAQAFVENYANHSRSFYWISLGR